MVIEGAGREMNQKLEPILLPGETRVHEEAHSRTEEDKCALALAPDEFCVMAAAELIYPPSRGGGNAIVMLEGGSS